MTAIRKNDAVYYDTNGATYRAKVVTAHKDGSATIAPACQVDADGDMVPYSSLGGFKFRMNAAALMTKDDLLRRRPA